MTPKRATLVLSVLALGAAAVAFRLRSAGEESPITLFGLPAFHASPSPDASPDLPPSPGPQDAPATANGPDPVGERRKFEIVDDHVQQLPRDYATPADIMWLYAHQNEDGSFGAESEEFEGAVYSRSATTGLAVLAILSHGYTHLSKEAFGDRTAGEGMKKALKWMIVDTPQDELGRAIGTMAWTESFGMTGSVLLKGYAETALKSLLESQRADGSWGDSWTSAWAAQTLRSAEISGMEVPAEAKERAGGWLKTSLELKPEPAIATAYLWLTHDAEHPALGGMRARLMNERPTWGQASFSYWYAGSQAMLAIDGQEGEGWQAWTESLRATLWTFRGSDGEWAGGSPSVVRQAYGALGIGTTYVSVPCCKGEKKKR